MNVSEAIKSLRDDTVSQRAGQRALESAKSDWLGATGAGLVAVMGRYAAGADLKDCHALSALLDSGEQASASLNELVIPLLEQMRQFPLGQVPFRHQYQQGMAVLQLITSGTAGLSLVLYEEREGPPPASACFTDSECHEIVMAGAGTVRMLQLDVLDGNTVQIRQSNQVLSKGDCLSISGSGETKQMIAVEGCMVALRLSRTPDTPMPSCEYRLTDGALLHRASGDRVESRQEMYVTLLGAMGRQDAATSMAEIAMTGGEQLRWQSLRNCLALNSAVGFQALCKIAADPDDGLATSAGALRAQLIEQYPQLGNIEDQRCLV